MERSKLINAIIGMMRGQAIVEKRHFDGADLFFSLAFMSDTDLNKIGKTLNILK